MKPHNWRTYYWYRPPSLSAPAMTPGELQRQAEAYIAWLRAEHHLSLDEAEFRLQSQTIEVPKPPRCLLIMASKAYP